MICRNTSQDKRKKTLRMSLVTRDHALLQMETVANYSTKTIEKKCFFSRTTQSISTILNEICAICKEVALSIHFCLHDEVRVPSNIESHFCAKLLRVNEQNYWRYKLVYQTQVVLPSVHVWINMTLTWCLILF